MAALFWALLMLCPFLACSQSGDDGESSDITCWSFLSLKKRNLTCNLNEDDTDIEFATLCPSRSSPNKCSNGTMGHDTFTFRNLEIIQQYKLHVYLKGGEHQAQNINLVKIVKIPTPDVENATYTFDEAIIHIRYKHDYVIHPEFQVEFWGEGANVKEKVNVKYKLVSIGGDKLRDSEIYNVQVRAKPEDYFDGSWTEWSKVKSFKVHKTAVKDAPLPVLYILLGTSPVLVLFIGFGILRWKKEIQAYLFPAVPHPKATLAQIHREMEHTPVSFSPEIYKDINIYPVAYAEEKKLTPDFGEDQGDTAGSCHDEVVALKCSRPTSTCETQDEKDQRLEAEMSHLKIKLLDECASAEEGENNPSCQSVTALQRYSKDETYVTMSSLYKTQ